MTNEQLAGKLADILQHLEGELDIVNDFVEFILQDERGRRWARDLVDDMAGLTDGP